MNTQRSLESYKIFPIIAWVLVFGFSLFVYTIVQDLRATTAELAVISDRLDQHAKTPAEDIANFAQ